MSDNKPRVHQSDIETMSMCGMRIYNNKILGWKRPASKHTVRGTATHAAVQADLQNKIDTTALLPDEAIPDLAAGAFDKTWDEEEVLLTEKDREEGTEKIRGEEKDIAVALSLGHHAKLAPIIVPVNVERGWVLELDGYPVDLAGTIDIEEPYGVRDTKTAVKSPSLYKSDAPEGKVKYPPGSVNLIRGRSATADSSLQLSMYGLAKRTLTGEEPKALYLDTLVKLKDSTKLVVQETTRTNEDYRAVLDRVEIYVNAMEKGVFIPARRDVDWWCSEAWCGFFEKCAFGRRGRPVPKS